MFNEQGGGKSRCGLFFWIADGRIYTYACRHVRRNMRRHMCRDRCVDICERSMHADMHMDICVDMCVNMCVRRGAVHMLNKQGGGKSRCGLFFLDCRWAYVYVCV